MCDTLDHIKGISNGVRGSDRKFRPPSSYWLGTPASIKSTRLVGSSDRLLAITAPAGPPPTTMKSYSSASVSFRTRFFHKERARQ